MNPETIAVKIVTQETIAVRIPKMQTAGARVTLSSAIAPTGGLSAQKSGP